MYARSEAFFSVPNCLECNGLENAKNQRAGSVEKLVTYPIPVQRRTPLEFKSQPNVTPALAESVISVSAVSANETGVVKPPVRSCSRTTFPEMLFSAASGVAEKEKWL